MRANSNNEQSNEQNFTDILISIHLAVTYNIDPQFHIYIPSHIQSLETAMWQVK